MRSVAPGLVTNSQEVNGLGHFKGFVYGSYHETHGVFRDETASAWERRIKGHVPVMRLMLPHDKDTPILDLGCGDGVLLAVAQSLGYTSLHGVDLSASLLQKAAKHTAAKLTHAEGLEFLRAQPDGAFGAIIAFDILEHLTRPELLAMCREIARTLKPGGRLIIRVPNGSSPIYGHHFWSDITHERPYTAGSLAQVLRPLGFARIEAVDLPPAAITGLKTLVIAALWRVYRAFMTLRLALETGQLRRVILTLNLHVIAHKDTRNT